jgi:MFS family permease
MGLGALLGGLSAQIAALTTHFGALVFVRWLAGLATACGLPATLGLLSAETAQDESLRGRVMGLFQLVTIGGTIIGILIGGRLWDLFHAQAFTLNHAIYLLSLLVFGLGIRETLTLRTRRTHAIVHGARALRRAFNYYREALLTPEVLRFAPAWLTINILLGIWLNQIVG